MIRANGFDWMVVQEIFQRDVYRVDLDNVQRILDLGGNIGLATVYFAGTYSGAQICTVEPVAENLAVLEQNLRLNGLAVKVVPAAVGTHDGKTSFQLSDDPRQYSSVGSQNQVAAVQRTVEVDLLSIPSLMDRMGWQELDLLKIDIEGGEKEVLAGQPSWLKKVRAIICEGHVGVGYSIDCARRDLEPMGFQLQILDQNSGAVLFFARRND
jgi:FkbM family methyltransferase